MSRPPEDRVRIVLSDLYLDTEIRGNLPGMALRLIETGVDASRIERIWREEITPALHWNLKSVAGEWAMFDADWLLDRIGKLGPSARASRVPIVGAIVHAMRSLGNDRVFHTLKTLRFWLLEHPEHERAAVTATWMELARLYFANTGGHSAMLGRREHERREIALGAADAHSMGLDSRARSEASATLTDWSRLRAALRRIRFDEDEGREREAHDAVVASIERARVTPR